MNRQQFEQQQGFYQNELIVNETEREVDYLEKESRRHQDLRVLSSVPISRKLPEEINSSFSSIAQMQFSIKKDNSKRNEYKQPSNYLTPIQMFEDNQAQFQLLYHKYNRSSVFQNRHQNFTYNEVSLQNIQRVSCQYYKILKPYVQQEVPKNLQFDSKFQSGNLLCVYQSKIKPYHYYMLIENDTNTNGFNQWFYFSIRGAKRSIKYKFHIVNLKKHFSFFKHGMKPIFFSMEKCRETGNGWCKISENLQYTISPIIDIQNFIQIGLYQLIFQFQAQYQKDYLTISSGIPYSYSRLINQLNLCQYNALSRDILWKESTIEYSLGKNRVPYIIIGTKDNDEQETVLKKYQKQFKKIKKKEGKPIIIILARQHPGQTNSSFLMQQILKQLTNTNVKQAVLLSQFDFHIFPMINVDGVIYGNNRCDLAGFDLNRTWQFPIKQLHPQIYAIKQKIIQLSKSKRIVYCLDLHSHSKQYNIFTYNCIDKDLNSKLFSYILSRMNQTFKYPFCTFGIEKYKSGTARAVISSIIKSSNVSTVQISSYASKIKESVSTIYPIHLQYLAQNILASLKIILLQHYNKEQMLRQIIKQQQCFQYKNTKAQEFHSSDSQEIDDKEVLEKVKIILPKKMIKKIQKNMKDNNNIFKMNNQQIQTAIISYDEQRKNNKKPLNRITTETYEKYKKQPYSNKILVKNMIQFPFQEPNNAKWNRIKSLKTQESKISKEHGRQIKIQLIEQNKQKMPTNQRIMNHKSQSNRYHQTKNIQSAQVQHKQGYNTKRIYKQLINKYIEQSTLKFNNTPKDYNNNFSRKDINYDNSVHKRKLSKLQRISKIRKKTATLKYLGYKQDDNTVKNPFLHIVAKSRLQQDLNQLSFSLQKVSSHCQQFIQKKEAYKKKSLSNYQMQQKVKSSDKNNTSSNVSLVQRILKLIKHQ